MTQIQIKFIESELLVVEPRPDIWQWQSQRDTERLVTALTHPDASVRRRAVMALRSLDAVQVVPALKAALARENDAQVRVSLQVAIQTLDPGAAPAAVAKMRDVHGLIRILQGRSPEQAITAARALGEIGDRIAVEPLIILFHNSAALPEVRLAAAEALLILKSAPAVVTLLGALRRESWEVRRNAAAVLGQIQATWAVIPLAAALDDPNPVVRRTAAAALRRIGTPDAMAVLRKRFGGQPAPGTASTTPVVQAVSSVHEKGEMVGASPTSIPASAPAVAAVESLAETARPPQASIPVIPPPTEMPTPERVVLDLTETPTLPHKSALPQPSVPPSAGPIQPRSEREDRITLLTRPVNRLIAFLKTRD